MRRRSTLPKWLLVGVFILICIVLFRLFMGGASTSDGQAREVVDQFYHYEQDGNFSKSWGLFHSSMRKKFSKSDYIQVRAHVFMADFDVDTFTYKVGKSEKLDEWKMAKTKPAYQNVYQVPITQTFKGKFGNFDVNQKVFVVKEKGEWRILWDYNR